MKVTLVRLLTHVFWGKGLSLLDFTRWGITLLLLSSLVYTKCLGFEVVVVVALGAVRVVDMDFYGM